LPDVAAHAGLSPGYIVRVGEESLVLGGTSASTALWTGLIARLNQGLGRRVGFLNPLLYESLGPLGVLRGITVGDNGSYEAGPGWNACTGWGVPQGDQLLGALKVLNTG
jgi:kumamolisin